MRFIRFLLRVKDVTHLLKAMHQQEPGAADRLMQTVYTELRLIAAAKMAREMPGQTLQATALVHEAWLRLGGSRAAWENRAHFFSAAAEAMRQILIENARRKRATRHGGGMQRVPIETFEIESEEKEEELLAVHEVLDAFATRQPQKAELVKLRYFVGLTIEEAAEILGISIATAKRHWVFARAWLFDAIREIKEIR